MIAKTRAIGILMVTMLISISCEVDTRLRMEGGNPPKFFMSGSGVLSRLVIRGPKTLRKIDGPDSSAYWSIEFIDYEKGKRVTRISPITYGTTPKGYTQIYPEQGQAPTLEENVWYSIQVDTTNANGAWGSFIIEDGKIRFAEQKITGN